MSRWVGGWGGGLEERTLWSGRGVGLRRGTLKAFAWTSPEIWVATFPPQGALVFGLILGSAAHLGKVAERCVCEGAEAEEALGQVPQGAAVAQTRSRGEQVLARAVLGEHGAQSRLRRAGGVQQEPLPSTPVLRAPAAAQGPNPTPASCLRGFGSSSRPRAWAGGGELPATCLLRS